MIRSANLFSSLPIFYGWIIVAVTFVTMSKSVYARTSFSFFSQLFLKYSNGIEAFLQGLSQLDL
jgi:hypothetical protein